MSALPPDWTIHEDPDGFFAQHSETLKTTSVRPSRDEAVRRAHQIHADDIDPLHTPMSKPNAEAPESSQAHDHPQTKALKLRAQQAPAQHDAEVYDADSGQMVTRTADDRRKAQTLDQALHVTRDMQKIILVYIQDGHHYLDHGFSSMRQYCEDRLPYITYRTAQRWVAATRPKVRLLPDLSAEGGFDASTIQQQVDSSDDVQKLDGFTQGAMQAIGSLDDATFEDIITEGKLVMPDGDTEFTLDELRTMKTKQLKTVMEEARMERQAYRARIQQLEEEVEKKQSEIETNAQTVEDAEEHIERARDIEALHGEAHRSSEGMIRRLTTLRERIASVRQAALGDGFTVGMDAPQAALNLLQDCFREANSIAAAIRDCHPGLVAADDTDHFAALPPGVDTSWMDDEIEAIAAEQEADTASGDGAVSGPEDIDPDGANPDGVDMDTLASVAHGSTKDAICTLQEQGWICEPTLDDQFVFTHKMTGESTTPQGRLADAVDAANTLQTDIDRRTTDTDDGDTTPMRRL